MASLDDGNLATQATISIGLLAKGLPMTAIASLPSSPLVKTAPKRTGTAKGKATIPNAVAVQGKTLVKKSPKKIVGKKTAKRPPTPTPTVERNYGLDAEKIAEFKKEKSHNAYREGSSYWAVVESLFSLGLGKMHLANDLIAEYAKQVDKDAFKAFKAKEKRNDATGLEWRQKVLQNAYVTTRQDYGKRMRDIGYEVRYERTDDGATYGLFRLTNGKAK
jgi:hypothetical protein